MKFLNLTFLIKFMKIYLGKKDKYYIFEKKYLF
jgi:hypothetical protein